MTGQAWVDRDANELGVRLDEAYEALMSTTSRFYTRRSDAWALSGVAGLDTPTMNRASILGASATAAPELVKEAAAFFEERGVPWSAMLSSCRPHSEWHSALLSLGMTYTSALDVMARPPGPLPVDSNVEVREVTTEELPLFTELLIEVFHMPRRFYPALHDMSEAWRREGAKLYFGLQEDEPVATALLSNTDGVAGIYNVGTRRVHRRRGFARALMERAMEDAMASSDVVTLQVSPGSVAEHFYLRLGFEQVHSWRFYTPGLRTTSLITRWKESPG